MKQIKYLSFIPFLALLCLMTGCENDKDVYYPYVNVPLTTHNPVLVEGEVLHIGIGLDGVNYRVESDNEDVVLPMSLPVNSISLPTTSAVTTSSLSLSTR